MFLATQVTDEARHIEAFTKRALAGGGGLRYSTALTQSSLMSLLEQEDFSQASFLLSVLGEGAFLEYLAFVERFAPDPVTRDIVRRARIDEARHVAFGVEHARHFMAADPERGELLRRAVERRASFLAETSASSPHVEERSWCSPPADSRPGHSRCVRAVRDLPRDDARHGGSGTPSARFRAAGRCGDLSAPYTELHVNVGLGR